jgi:hypothetical protein
MNRFELMYAADYLRTEAGITTQAAMVFRNRAGTDSKLINCKNSTSFLPKKLNRLAKSKYGSRSTFEDIWIDELLELNRNHSPILLGEGVLSPPSITTTKRILNYHVIRKWSRALNLTEKVRIYGGLFLME